MKILVGSILGFLMVFGGALAAEKAASGEEAALRAIEEKWDAASLKGDAAALAAILADTFVSTNGEGKVRTKAELVAQLQSGDTKYEIAKVSDMKVHVYGDAAVVNGAWRGKFADKGKPVDTTERFTDTYVRSNGQWRCVASHSSTVK